MSRGLHPLLLAVCLASCATAGEAPPADPRVGSVTAQDFFFYSCVREYMQYQSIRVFDGSVAYAVEYIQAPHEVLDRIYEAARDFALGIRAPDYTDEEHGLPAVLVLCRQESESGRVAALVEDAMSQYRQRTAEQ